MAVKEKRKVTAGEQFGRWTVLDDCICTEKGERKWLCHCACGTKRYVLERSLLCNGSVSCGCLRKERAAQALSLDLTGKQFGELTVIQKIKKEHRHGTWWLCQCSCGETYEVMGSLLVTGKRTHCSGKSHKRNYAYVDITGQKFGRLTALTPSGKRCDKKGSVIWKCRCECGNEVEISYNHLMYTNLKSCGCQKKEHSQKLNGFLTHVAGTSVDILKSKKVPTDNTTGYKGVYLIRGKYVAKIVFQKKAYYLGNFDRIEDAVLARKDAEELLFDGVAEYYEKWKALAQKNPGWGEEHPIEVTVTQKADKTLSVLILPDLAKV